MGCFYLRVVNREYSLSNNYIVLRASPDWLNFNLDDSRVFCKKLGMSEDLIVSFADRWQRTFRMDFREFRHEMKQIALATIAVCRNCQLLASFDLRMKPADDDLFVFMDDDDWIAPGLFETLRALDAPRDGFLWGSIHLGKFLVDLPRIPLGTPVLHKRALLDVVSTNNYGMTGRAIKRLGIQAIFEHYRAQETLGAGAFRPDKVPYYLSCANKHPCCTMYAHLNSPYLSEGLRPTIAAYAEALCEIQLDRDTLWIAPSLRRLEAIVSRSLAATA